LTRETGRKPTGFGIIDSTKYRNAPGDVGTSRGLAPNERTVQMRSNYTLSQNVLTPELISQFWTKVNKQGPDECWEWTGSCLPTLMGSTGPYSGYGRLTIFDPVIGKRRMEYAHRIAFLIAGGSIPEGVIVMHDCDNPPCCNPDHLLSGTYSKNSIDRDSKKRRSTSRSRALALSIDESLIARHRYERGEDLRMLAKRHHVSVTTIRKSLIRVGTNMRRPGPQPQTS